MFRKEMNIRRIKIFEEMEVRYGFKILVNFCITVQKNNLHTITKVQKLDIYYRTFTVL